MARVDDRGSPLDCSFCGKNRRQVKKLIAGPHAFICDECVGLCNDIIEEELAEIGEPSTATARLRRVVSTGRYRLARTSPWWPLPRGRSAWSRSTT